MEHTSHPHGTFCFAELQTSDPARDARFYGELLGWTASEGPAGGGTAGFTLGGKNVAGMRRADAAHRWVPYVSVASADAAAARAEGLGAQLVQPPFEMAGAARLAVVHDPAGGVVGFWEAKGHPGAAVLDDPGALWWAELLTRDVLVAKTFYAGLFDWQAVETLKYGIRYSVFKLGNDSVGGLLPIRTDWGEMSPTWQVLFAVDDCDRRIAQATSLGGSVIFGPNDVPNAGRAAVLADAGGATFVLMQPQTTAATT